MLHPSPAGVGHTAEMPEMLAAQRPCNAHAVLFVIWSGAQRGKVPHPFLLSGCPRSRPAHIYHDAMASSVGKNWLVRPVLQMFRA